MLQGKLISDHYTKSSFSLQGRSRKEGESNLLRYILGNDAAYFAQWEALVFKKQFYKTK